MTSAPVDAQPAPEPGVYEHVPSEQYHSWDGNVLSKSKLWPMVTGFHDDGSLELCPAKLQYEMAHPREQTPEMAVGDALDCLLLEPHEFEQRYVMAQSCQAPKRKGSDEVCGAPGKVLVDGEWRCGTHGRGGDAVAPDKTLLDHVQMTQVRAMAASIRQHAVADMYFDEPHKPQVALVGDIYGRRFKGRFDLFRSEHDGSCAILDLKTARSHRPHAFKRDAIRLGYHVQAFIYFCLAYANDWITSDDRIELIVVGKTPIYGIGRDAVYPVEVFPVGDDLLAIGQRHTEQLVDAVNECEEAGEWPIYHGQPAKRELNAPDWLTPDEGSDGDADE